MECLCPLYHSKDINVSSTHATDLTSSPESLCLIGVCDNCSRIIDHDRNGAILHCVVNSLLIVVVDLRGDC